MMAERKGIKLIWSFMHDDENALCPFVERKLEVSRLSFLCRERIGPEKEIYGLALTFQHKARLSSKDAVHLACSHHARCGYFLTCDQKLIKKAKRLDLDIEIMNPVDYIMEVARQ